MPHSYPYDTSSAALLHPAHSATFFADWQPADTHNHDLLGAEFSRLAYADESTVRAALARVGFAATGFFGGESAGARLTQRGTQGFVARHAGLGLTVVAFRGTESDKFEDLVSDLSTLPVAHPGGGRVHRGFWRAYEPIRERLAALVAPRDATLLITGHSLGAALATLAAADLTPAKLVTFGSPRVGDAAFAARLAGLVIRRYVGCCDVVTRVPPEQFDESHLATLFAEIGDFAQLGPVLRRAAEFAARHTAQALAKPFAAVAPAIAFTHVAPVTYIDAAGRRHEAPDAAFIAADQAAARARYPHAPARSLDTLTALLRELDAPGRSASPRDFLRGLFALARSDRVPLRDLADHAPLNYVSALSGRL